MPDIMHVVKIHASPEQVYEALTTDEGIRNWWTRDAVLDSAIGGVGEFGFFNRRVVTKVKIDELKPPIRVAWTTISSAAPGGWDDTRITFDLRPEAGDTVLCFAHRGFKQADEGYARTTTGWGYYLVSLQQYLEAGKGAPHPDVDFARVIDRPDFRMPTASKWRAPRAVADGGEAQSLRPRRSAHHPSVSSAPSPRTRSSAGGDTLSSTARRSGPRTSVSAANGASPCALPAVTSTTGAVSSSRSMRRTSSS